MPDLGSNPMPPVVAEVVQIEELDGLGVHTESYRRRTAVAAARGQTEGDPA